MAEVVKKRKRKEPDEYTKLRKQHRKATSRHVLVLEADMPENDKRHIFNLANRLRVLSNEITGQMKKDLDQMQRTHIYKETAATYKTLRDKLSAIKDESSEQHKKIDAERKAVGKQLNALHEKYNVTWDVARKIAETRGKYYDVPSVFALSCAEDVWSGVEKVLYSNGQKLHFKKRGDLCSIRAKQITNGIIPKLKNGELSFNIVNGNSFGIVIKEKDVFAKTEVDKLIAFLSDKNAEEKFIELYKKTGTPQDTFRICYCSLVCEEIRGKLRIFVHITIEGKASRKVDKDGKPRHNFQKGAVSTDIGTQSIAVVSEHGLILDNLAERHGVSTKKSERAQKILQRKLDRSRRAMNPTHFNEDGTYKKGSNGKWKKSKNYIKNERILKNIRRKNAASREYAINEMSNNVRSLGDILITEPSNAKALQKKAKPSAPITDPKTGETKHKRRKRFGKSILYRCPGKMFSTLKNKFEQTGGYFNTVNSMFRASQYDHKSNAYIKKKLSQRWHVFADGTKVQRDLYSAFLMFCSDGELKSPDRARCELYYEFFYNLHTDLIADIRKSGKNICNSGIKITT